MTPNLPLCASREAYRLLSQQLRQIENRDALLTGAVAISLHQDAKCRALESADTTIQSYVDTIRSRVHGRQPQALVAHLHDYLFDELGFVGNVTDYYNPANSYLPNVLETKRGLPITLALIYKTVAERLGLRVWGVGLPGHFLNALDCGQGIMLIDAFNGGCVISRDEAIGKMRSVLGEETEWSEELLAPVSNRHWLTRILQNLLNVFGSMGRYADVAAMLEMEMLLWPEQDRLQRDLGLVLARVGLSESASTWINHYLANNPDDPLKTDLRQLLHVLQT
jgi:regulator of sirC expression with transglutaminase-like and TPR domain